MSQNTLRYILDQTTSSKYFKTQRPSGGNWSLHVPSCDVCLSSPHILGKTWPNPQNPPPPPPGRTNPIKCLSTQSWSSWQLLSNLGLETIPHINGPGSDNCYLSVCPPTETNGDPYAKLHKGIQKTSQTLKDLDPENGSSSNTVLSYVNECAQQTKRTPAVP